MPCLVTRITLPSTKAEMHIDAPTRAPRTCKIVGRLRQGNESRSQSTDQREIVGLDSSQRGEDVVSSVPWCEDMKRRSKVVCLPIASRVMPATAGCSFRVSAKY